MHHARQNYLVHPDSLGRFGGAVPAVVSAWDGTQTPSSERFLCIYLLFEAMDCQRPLSSLLLSQRKVTLAIAIIISTTSPIHATT